MCVWRGFLHVHLRITLFRASGAGSVAMSWRHHTLKNIKSNYRSCMCDILHIDWCVKPFARISCWLYFYNRHLRGWKFLATKISFFSQTSNKYYWMRASPTRYLLFHDVIHSVLMGHCCQQIQTVPWSAYVIYRKTGYKVRPMYWLDFDLAQPKEFKYSLKSISNNQKAYISTFFMLRVQVWQMNRMHLKTRVK